MVCEYFSKAALKKPKTLPPSYLRNTVSLDISLWWPRAANSKQKAQKFKGHSSLVTVHSIFLFNFLTRVKRKTTLVLGYLSFVESFKTWVVHLPVSKNGTRRNFWKAHYIHRQGSGEAPGHSTHFPLALRECEGLVMSSCLKAECGQADQFPDSHTTHPRTW